jgi:hypothetical protein
MASALNSPRRAADISPADTRKLPAGNRHHTKTNPTEKLVPARCLVFATPHHTQTNREIKLRASIASSVIVLGLAENPRYPTLDSQLFH